MLGHMSDWLGSIPGVPPSHGGSLNHRYDRDDDDDDDDGGGGEQEEEEDDDGDEDYDYDDDDDDNDDNDDDDDDTSMSDDTNMNNMIYTVTNTHVINVQHSFSNAERVNPKRTNSVNNTQHFKELRPQQHPKKN